jgi:hypothetical protein
MAHVAQGDSSSLGMDCLDSSQNKKLDRSHRARFEMFQRAALIITLLGMTHFAHASDVTMYGAGLRSCTDYLQARQQDSVELVGYTDWMSGYLSGVNTTSKHRNNFLSHEDLEGAMVWLDGYCSEHAAQRLAEAAWVLVIGARTGSAAHSVEAAAYGAGYKSCDVYTRAREESDTDLNVDRTQFIAWLGGYLSGVNVMSFQSANALGGMQMDEAARWLDAYCGAHGQATFGVAVQSLLVDARPTPGTSLASAHAPAILHSEPSGAVSH